jgi:hypothetical protein
MLGECAFDESFLVDTDYTLSVDKRTLTMPGMGPQLAYSKPCFRHARFMEWEFVHTAGTNRAFDFGAIHDRVLGMPHRAPAFQNMLFEAHAGFDNPQTRSSIASNGEGGGTVLGRLSRGDSRGTQFEILALSCCD